VGAPIIPVVPPGAAHRPLSLAASSWRARASCSPTARSPTASTTGASPLASRLHTCASRRPPSPPRSCGSLASYSETFPELAPISRTKLRGVLALLKTVGVFICSKEGDESLTTMALREDLDCFVKFREAHDLGVLAYASFNRCAPL
jgi:hypothetical protein